jgi:hypothetical protein
VSSSGSSHPKEAEELRLEAEDDEEVMTTGTDCGRDAEGRIDLTVLDMRRSRSSQTLALSDCHFSKASNSVSEEVIEMGRRDRAKFRGSRLFTPLLTWFHRPLPCKMRTMACDHPWYMSIPVSSRTWSSFCIDIIDEPGTADDETERQPVPNR